MVDRRDNREDIVKLQVHVEGIIKEAEKERIAVNDFKDDVAQRFDTVDNRLRVIERNMYYAIGGLAVLQFLLKYLH
jgi:hypothetical protein